MDSSPPIQRIATQEQCSEVGLLRAPNTTSSETLWGGVAWEGNNPEEAVFYPYVGKDDDSANAGARAAGVGRLRVGGPTSKFWIPTSAGAWFGLSFVAVIVAAYVLPHEPRPAIFALLPIAFVGAATVLIPKMLTKIGRENVAELPANDIVVWRVQESLVAGTQDPATVIKVLRQYAFTDISQDEALALVEAA